MTTVKAWAVAAVAMMVTTAAGAQTAPAPTPAAVTAPAAAPARCGGLFCDLYYAGTPAGQAPVTALPCRDFVCGMFGGRTAEQPVAAAEPERVEAPEKPKRKRVARHVAKESARENFREAGKETAKPKAEPAAQ